VVRKRDGILRWAEGFDSVGREVAGSGGGSEEGTDDGASVAVVAADAGVGEEGVFELVGIFPS
jgi:hypothetical protein